MKDVRSESRFCLLVFVVFCVWTLICCQVHRFCVEQSLLPCQGLTYNISVGLFLSFVFYSIDLLSILLPLPCCVDYYRFILNLEVSQCQSFNFVVLQYYVGYSGLLPLHIHFRITLLMSPKWIVLDYQNCIEYIFQKGRKY